MKEELERAQAEEQRRQEIKRQEDLDMIKSLKERLNFLNEEARALVRPHLQTLQESGAIEVLRELKEVAGIEKEVGIEAKVSYPSPWIIETDKRGVDKIVMGFEDMIYFRASEGQIVGGFHMSHKLEEDNPNPVDVREELRKYSLVNPKKFRDKGCDVSLLCYYDCHISGGEPGNPYYDIIIRKLLFRSLWPAKAVKLLSVEEETPKLEVEKDLFYFPERDWQKRELLERVVAKSYCGLVKKRK